MKNPRSKGSWSLPKVLGPPADVIEQVKGAAFVPESAKAMLAEAIRLQHGQCKLIRLDAHCNVFERNDRSQTVINIHLSEL